MKTRKFRTIISLAGVALIAVVLAFSGLLNMFSFRKNYVDSLASSYTVSGGECRRKIEYAIKYGKLLHNFFGIKNLLAEIPADSPEIKTVEISMPGGRVLYDLDGPVAERVLPAKLAVKADFSKGRTEDASRIALHKGMYHALIPIRDREAKWIGTLDLGFEEAEVDRRTAPWTREAVRNMAIVALLVIACFLVFVRPRSVFTDDGVFKSRRLSNALFLILGISQVAFGVINAEMFRRAYAYMARQNSNVSSQIVRKTIQGVVQKGIDYEDLVGVDEWMSRVDAAIPEIERISILDRSGTPLYSSRGKTAAAVVPAEYRIDTPLVRDRSGHPATLSIVLSAEFLKDKTRSVVLDALTGAVVSFFMLVELVIFLAFVLRRQIESAAEEHERKARSGGVSPAEEQGIRTLAFMLLISFFLSASFIPILMGELYRPLFGLSRNVILGLPITVEMLGTLLATLASGAVIDRAGWRAPFMAGLGILAVGTLLSAIATDAIPFILARGLSGIGYGIAWMGLRALVATAPSVSARNHGFSALNAGIFAGINCGAVLGGMWGDRLGLSAVFYFGFVGVAIAAMFAFLYTYPAEGRPPVPMASGAVHTLRSFLFEPTVLLFFLLVTIPSAITGMYLYYFFPLHAKSLGVSQSDIGRGFLLYGVCVIFVGPYIIRKVAGRLDGRLLTVAAGFVGVAALFAFASQGTFIAALAAVLLLGISESVGLVSQNSYFVNLPQSEALGQGKALSLFSTAKKAGQMLGPNVYGWATAAAGVLRGVGTMAAAYAVLTAAFLFATWRQVRQETRTDESAGGGM